MSTLLESIALKAIPAPYVGQQVLVEGKTPGEVKAVCRQTRMAAVRTAAGELIPAPFAWLYEEA